MDEATSCDAEALGEGLLLRRGLCIPLRHVRSDCRACTDACERRALRRDGGRWSMATACDSCGACIGACPTGALEWRLFPAAEVHRQIADTLADSPGADIAFSCRRSEAQRAGSIKIPCAVGLEEAMLVGAVLRGAQGVRVLLGDCRTCPGGRQARAMLGRLLRVVRRILRAARIDPRCIRLGEGTRRPGRACASVGPKRGEPPAGKRNRLVEEIRESRVDLDPVSAAGLPMGTASIGPECIGCSMCEYVCAPRAIVRDQLAGGRIGLSLDAGLCIACGACVASCALGALRLLRADDLSMLTSRGLMQLTTLSRRECMRCGAFFNSGPPALVCSRCRR